MSQFCWAMLFSLSWSQTIWHTDGIPKRFFWKCWFWKKLGWQDGILYIFQLSQTSLDISLKILQSLSTSTQRLSNGGESRVEELIPLAVQTASSIIKSASGYGKHAERELEEVYKHIITESLTAVEELTLVSWLCLLVWSCCLMITFANSLDPGQALQNVGPDLDTNFLTLW